MEDSRLKRGGDQLDVLFYSSLYSDFRWALFEKIQCENPGASFLIVDTRFFGRFFGHFVRTPFFDKSGL